MEKISFERLFKQEKPIMGMIHLAGNGRAEKVKRALEELAIYGEEEVDGAIIEDYHGSVDDVQEVLKQSQGRFDGVVRGVNVLRNPCLGFKFAQDYGAKFVQFDSVHMSGLDLDVYNSMRIKFPNIVVLGGVGFKYIRPTGNSLELDLEEGKSRCEAIVTTGSGTGVETPIDKLKQYKELLEEFPLIVGAGVDLENVYDQLKIVDGVIIGSYFKLGGDTHRPIERQRVRDLMNLVGVVRGF